MAEPNDESRARLGPRARVIARTWDLGDDLQPAIRRHIGDQLRRMYAGFLDQRLPGRLLVLLSRMERDAGRRADER